MSDGKIYITISDTRQDGATGRTGDDISTKIKKKSDEEALKDYAQHRFFNFIESEAKNIAQYSLNNIGNFTGDYNAQRSVNQAMSVIGVASNIGLAALAGAKYGPYGALIAGSIATVSQTINFGLQLKSQNLEITRQNYSISQLKQLSGLDGLTNGGRI